MPEPTAQPNPDSSLVTRHSSLSLEEARSLVASPLWPRIRDFLWDFASLCDPARLAAALAPAGGSGDLPRSLAASPRAARAAEQALGLAPFFHSFPSTDSSRLLLLSREDYDRLAQFLGVVALAPALRRVTAGAEVRALKAAVPDYRETLAFAAYFHRFEALFKRFEAAEQAATPAVENHSAFSIQHSALPAAVPAAGHSILAAAFSELPPELLLRQRLRFPAGSPADAALGGASSPSEPQAADSADHSAFSIQHSALAGAALAAARLALKLSNPAESAALALSS